MSLIQDYHEQRKARLERLGRGQQRAPVVAPVVEITVRAFAGTPDGYVSAINGVPPEPPPPPPMSVEDIQAALANLSLQLERARQAAGDPSPTVGEREELVITPPPSIERVIRAVAGYYKVSCVDIRGERRTKNVIRPRHVAMYLCATLTGRSLPMIGRLIGDRDHTSALHGRDKIKKLRLEDPDLNSEILEIERILQAAS